MTCRISRFQNGGSFQLKKISHAINRGIDTVKITALSNHKPGILNNYIRININLSLNIH